MGSLLGHVVPGAFFFVIGLWWALRMLMRFYSSLRRDGGTYRSTVTFPPNLRSLPNVDLEAIVGVAFCVTGIIIETLIAYLLFRTPTGMNNGQHATMYAVFGIAYLMVLLNRRIRIIPTKTREDMEYTAMLLAFVVESVLFKFHLFGREDIDIFVHVLLLYTAYACIISTIIEMIYRNNIVVSLARAYFLMLQGTWFNHVGFILYNPAIGNSWGHSNPEAPTGEAEHMAKMLYTLYFAWHMIILFLIFFVSAVVIGQCYAARGDFDRKIMLQTRFSKSAEIQDMFEEDKHGASQRLLETEEQEEEM